MEYAQVLRRVAHLLIPGFLVYYLLPEEIASIPKRFGLILIMLLALWVDGVRLIKQWKIPGARPYEKTRISSACWAGLGMMIAFLYSPEEYVVPVLFGMAWIDPLMGEIRKRGKINPVIPGIPCYLILVIAVDMIFFSLTEATLPIGVIASVSACIIEHYGPLWLDDDFSMIIIPLVILHLTGAAFPI